MVGIIIGSGIFRQPPEIARALDSPILILSLWLVGGLLALCGALTYSELATMYPQSGGVYVFLREGLGRGTAFVFGWTYMLISKPFAAAGIAVVCAESFNRLAGRPPGADVPLLVCGVLIALTALNTLGMRLGAGVAGALTIAKVGALVAMVLLALLLGAGDPANLSAPTAASAGASGVADSRGAGWALFSGIVVVMAAVMWTYDGWSDVGAVAGAPGNAH